MSKFIKKADLILLLILLLLCGGLLLWNHRTASEENLTAVIMQNGEEIEEISLDKVTEPYSISLDCKPAVTIRVEPGCIYYASADCPDKLCVRAGKLQKAGDTAACLPSKTLIVVKGPAEEGQPDVLTY